MIREIRKGEVADNVAVKVYNLGLVCLFPAALAVVDQTLAIAETLLSLVGQTIDISV